MKISIERDTLLRALGHVHSVVERRNTIPILSNVFMDAGDNRITFVATDLDIEISHQSGTGVDAPGSVTAPAHVLYDIARKLPDGSQVSLAVNADGRLDVDAGNAHFSLPLLPPGDFPKMTAEDFTHNFVLSVADLSRLVDKTKFAISTEETRYYLNGIHMHTHDNALRCVATDGHRLALAEMVMPGGAKDLPGIIIPRKTVAEIRRLIDGRDENVNLSVSDTKIRFNFASAVLTSKLIDGTFPDYERVIPRTNTKELSVNNGAFKTAVDRVATISTEKTRSVKLSLEKDSLALVVNTPDGGNAREDMMIDYNSDPLEIGFNARYLLDVAAQIEGDEATFFLDGPAAPALVKDSDDRNSLYVLMPLRV
ncbi:MAG: DNA polymerase III subunit beta [Hyphomonadaceae bacterium]|nr:DNA polymerase III subunit beta [Hyphomonadaceae bacterium]